MTAPIHPAIRDRLLIVPPDDVRKKVAFCDLNPIQSFRFDDPPILLMERTEVARLKAHIKLLEQQLEKKVSQVSPPPSPVSSRSSKITTATVPNVYTPVVPSVAPIKKPTIAPSSIPKFSPARRFAIKFFNGLGLACAAAAIPSLVFCFVMPPIGIAALFSAFAIGSTCLLISAELQSVKR